MKQKIFLLFISLLTALTASFSAASAYSDNIHLLYYSKADAGIQQNKADQADHQKSPLKAFLFSAAVPGTGHLYSGAKRGTVYIAAEITFWVSYFNLHGRAADIKDSYLKYIDEHIAFEPDSPATSTKSWTLEDYEHATQSDNWHYVYTENNGEPIDRVGKFYWKDLPKDKIQEPGGELVTNSKFRTEAYGKRTSTNKKFKQAGICVGLVVVNHIISAVDARIAAKTHNNQFPITGVEISLSPAFPPHYYPGAYFALNKRF